MWPELKKNSTAFLLVMLAVFDNIVLIIHFILRSLFSVFNFFHIAPGYTDRYKLANIYGWSISHWAQDAGCWNIVLLCFCRYIALCMPYYVGKFTGVRTIAICLGIVTLIVTVFDLPWIIHRYATIDSNGKVLITFLPYAKSYGFFIYEVPIKFVVMYLVPFTLLIGMTVSQIRAYRKNKKTKQSLTTSNMKDMNITITLMVVVLVFMVCQVWEPIRRLVKIVSGVDNVYLCQAAPGTFALAVIRIFGTVTNSAVNFLIYCIFMKGFRSKFKARCGFLFYRGTVANSELIAEQNENNGNQTIETIS
jgi:hypothetical protein